MNRARKAFTLVELLVVIGIIAVLLAILLPALSKARQQAYTVVCSSHLRTIGQGIAQYADDFHGVFPWSNYYKFLGYDPVSGQTPSTPNNGYVHWSSFLFGRKDIPNQDQTSGAVPAGQTNTDQLYKTLKGWEVFTCPALNDGGLAPANTYSDNVDPGMHNEDGITDAQIGQPPSFIDYQAPRLAYTLNEALCPRGIFQPFFKGNVRVYKFVPVSRVQSPSSVILATELWGNAAMESTNSQMDQTPGVSNSRRPVNAVSTILTGYQMQPDSAYVVPYTANYAWASPLDVYGDPESTMSVGSSVGCSLDYVGRNHGTKHLGVVSFVRNGIPQSVKNWDLRLTNFLYVDGHVEAKNIVDTLFPSFQWGTDFYTLDR